MFNKRVVVFGRSIPLAALVLAIASTVALAAFVGSLLISGNAVGTSASGANNVTLDSVACVLINALAGATVTCAAVSTSSFDISLNQIDNDGSLRVSLVVDNNGTNAACWVAYPTSIWGNVDQFGIGITPATVIAAGAQDQALRGVSLFFNAVTPGQNLAQTLNFTFEPAGDGLGVCP